MKKLFLLTALSGAIVLCSCQNATKTKDVLKKADHNDSISYALGVNYAAEAKAGMERSGQTFNNKLFVMGFADYFEVKEQISNADAISMLNEHFANLQSADNSSSLQQPSNEENMTYLTNNAAQEGVKTTPSGLQYKVIKQGSGKKPAAQDKVKVLYKGLLTNGFTFDESVEPIEFFLNQVIQGWTEGLQLMPVGSKYEFTIPPDLGYGSQEIPNLIPANSILIFEVELLDIIK